MAQDTTSGTRKNAEKRPSTMREARIRAVPEAGLQEAPRTPGIVRRFAFREDGFKVMRVHGSPGIASGWHHHGGHDVYGFVISGHMRFEAGPGGRDTIQVGPGDFFFVPAGLIHRDVNPSDSEPQEGVLYLVGDGPLVVNVDGPEPA